MNANKALLALVIGMGVVIAIAVAVLSYGLVQRASNPSFRFFSSAAPEAAMTGADIAVSLPAGTSVVSVRPSGQFLLVHTVDETNTSAVLFLDPDDGRVVRRILFERQ